MLLENEMKYGGFYYFSKNIIIFNLNQRPTNKILMLLVFIFALLWSSLSTPISIDRAELIN
jgi:hypothetical protein